MSERCDGRVTRENGDWRPCAREKGHGIDSRGFGCSTYFAGEDEPAWNPRDIERRKTERRWQGCANIGCRIQGRHEHVLNGPVQVIP